MILTFKSAASPIHLGGARDLWVVTWQVLNVFASETMRK